MARSGHFQMSMLTFFILQLFDIYIRLSIFNLAHSSHCYRTHKFNKSLVNVIFLMKEHDHF